MCPRGLICQAADTFDNFDRPTILIGAAGGFATKSRS